MKGTCIKITFMIEYISTIFKKHFVLLNTWTSSKFQSRSVVKSSNEELN